MDTIKKIYNDNEKIENKNDDKIENIDNKEMINTHNEKDIEIQNNYKNNDKTDKNSKKSVKIDKKFAKKNNFSKKSPKNEVNQNDPTKQKKHEKLKIALYFVLTFVFSYGLGVLFRDQYLLGSTTLYLGFVQTYFMTKGKWYEEFVGIFETIMSAIVCVFACMYGSAIFTFIIYIPLSIFSIVNWKKHANDDEVALNKMSTKKSVLTILIIIVSTVFLSFLLWLIPTQKLAAFDAAGDILNIAGILLIALRFKEGWICWILCNFVDLGTWITALIKDYSSNAIMMIIMSIAYLGLNIWGYNSFIKMRKNQELKTPE